MKTVVIDPTSETPPYEQLMRQLIDQITSGALPVDSKLPPVRRLAADLALAPGTVARAYRELVSDGYLVSRGRNGTVVAPEKSRSHTHIDAEQTNIDHLTAQYIARMRSLGLKAQDIVDRVQSGLLEH